LIYMGNEMGIICEIELNADRYLKKKVNREPREKHEIKKLKEKT
jgi:hypothetical protein